MPKAIVSVTNDLFTDQRVHKVCLFLVQQGYDVLLVGRLRPNSQPLDRSYRTHRMKLSFEKGALFYAAYSIRLFFFLLFRKADVLVSNDLDTLLPNYLISRLKRKSTLVYDTHEYFTEVPELVSRPRIQAIWEKIEGWIFPRLDKIYTVNGSIAERYSTKYRKQISVVRNISPQWHGSAPKSREALGLPADKSVVIFQGAGINIDRGAEEAVLAMEHIQGAILLFIGDGDILPQLKTLVQKHSLEEKVWFLGKMPYAEMMNYTRYADIGLTLDKDTNLNYRFSLPNKVFDYMHAGTPILASGVVEVRKIVEKYSIGNIIRSHDPVMLAEDIREMLENRSMLETYKQNCRTAALSENWEEEQKILLTIYPSAH